MAYRIPFKTIDAHDSYDDIKVRFVDGKLYPTVCVRLRRSRDLVPQDMRAAHESIREEAATQVQWDWWTRTCADIVIKHLAPAFRDRHIHFFPDGDDDDWLIVRGIGTPDEWTPTQRAAWVVFESAIERSVEKAERDLHVRIRELSQLTKWKMLTKRTDDPKLSWIERQLDRAGIAHRRNGNSFHAPIMEVEEARFPFALRMLDPIDDVEDDDPRFTDPVADEERGRCCNFAKSAPCACGRAWACPVHGSVHDAHG